MTKETMTIHEALTELKTLDKRIKAAINDNTWVIANKHSNNKIGGEDLSKYTETVESQYQKVRDLIRRREAIKRAVVQSNAVTVISVNGREYTVAEAIDVRATGIELLKALLTKLSMDYRKAKNMADMANGETLDRRADEHIRITLGTTDVKGMVDEVKKMRAEFIAAQTMELVDPIDCLKEMEKLEEQIAAFDGEIDSALSISNALTKIEIEY